MLFYYIVFTTITVLWKPLIAVRMSYIILKATKEKGRWKQKGVSHPTISKNKY